MGKKVVRKKLSESVCFRQMCSLTYCKTTHHSILTFLFSFCSLSFCNLIYFSSILANIIFCIIISLIMKYRLFLSFLQPFSPKKRVSMLLINLTVMRTDIHKVFTNQIPPEMKSMSYLQQVIMSSVVCWNEASHNGVTLICAQRCLVASLMARGRLLAWELLWLSSL